MKLINSLFPILALAGFSAAAGPKYPKPPGITFLYTVNITGGDRYPVGTGPYGNRIVVPILSGSFAGPKLKGMTTATLSLPFYFHLGIPPSSRHPKA